jgi:acetylornithine deacetylase/succinyl-diaminopimelate desuccinylase-like protein
VNRTNEEPLRTLVQRLADLVGIQSFSGQEQSVSRYIAEALAGSGADIEVDSDHNVAAILAPAGHTATLHVAGHMDTVPPGRAGTATPLRPSFGTIRSSALAPAI